MAMLFITPNVGGSSALAVKVAIDGGLSRNIEQMEDVARSVAGSLLVTQMASDPDYRETVPCQTVPISETEAEALVDAIRSAAFHFVAIDTTTADPMDTPIRTTPTTFECHAVIRSITPITVPGERLWVVSFDLIES